MRVSEIKTHDPSFGPYTCRLAEDFQFVTLSALDEIKPNSITFVKNRRLLQQFLDFCPSSKNWKTTTYWWSSNYSPR